MPGLHAVHPERAEVLVQHTLPRQAPETQLSGVEQALPNGREPGRGVEGVGVGVGVLEFEGGIPTVGVVEGLRRGEGE